MSGKSNHKKPPYQPHQAYSILHWRPKGSLLRLEVEDLWARRNEDSVQETLKLFLKETTKGPASTSEKLLFHMAVMRWKCSIMAPNEHTTLHNRIKEQKSSKEAMRTLPWSVEASEHGDGLFTENTYVQWYVAKVFFVGMAADLYLTAALMPLQSQYKWRLRRLSDKPVGKRWSFLVVPNPEQEQFPATCKTSFTSLSFTLLIAS